MGAKGRRQRSMARAGIAEVVAASITHAAGSSWGFGLALGTVILWAVTGPIFHWSDTWQLVINTGTTVVTFLMVFLVQRTQNRDGLAIQLKLNELVAAIAGASNRLIDVESLSEKELETLHTHFQRLVEMARSDLDVAASHSIEEAEQRHFAKREQTPHRQREGKSSGGAKNRPTSSKA